MGFGAHGSDGLRHAHEHLQAQTTSCIGQATGTGNSIPLRHRAIARCYLKAAYEEMI